MKLYAIRVFVRNWDESCAFYRDSLKLTERYRNDELGWAEYDLGGPCFGLQRVDSGDDEGETLVGRFLGVSLHVDDIDATYAELRTRGVRFTSPPAKQEWGGALAHFADPDGNELTLLG
ncbi:MAG: VOC family protein [Gammaproteobacteria bacterium]